MEMSLSRPESNRITWEPRVVYLYRADGRCESGRITRTQEQFRSLVPSILENVQARREVVITDSYDELVFYSVGGRTLWDGMGMSRLLNSTL